MSTPVNSGAIHVVASPRGHGKTTEMVKRCAAINAGPRQVAYIVTLDRRRALNIQRIAESLGLSERVPFPITLPELLRGQVGRWVSSLLFDDVDDMLRLIGGQRSVAAFSYSSETTDG